MSYVQQLTPGKKHARMSYALQLTSGQIRVDNLRPTAHPR